MRIQAINTVPIRYINKSTKTQNSYISNQISFGISEHERRVKDRIDAISYKHLDVYKRQGLNTQKQLLPENQI